MEQTNSLISELTVAEMLLYTAELKRDRHEPLKARVPDGPILFTAMGSRDPDDPAIESEVDLFPIPNLSAWLLSAKR